MEIEIPDKWRLSADGKAIERTLKFRDFREAFDFMTRMADHAEAVDHHPEFTSAWNRLDLRLTSHDAGRVTDRDLALARWIDENCGTSGVQD